MKKKENILEKIPTHVAIIMDGNGTWAKKRGLPRNFGHKKGSATLIDIVKYASSIGIKYLTVFAFSTENWSRPQEEVDYLMKLPYEFIHEQRDIFMKENIRFKTIGNEDRIPKDIKEEIIKFEEETKDHTGINFIVAFNYGAQDEIVNAVNSIIKDGITHVDKAVIENYLYTKDIPSVDLLIRTSGQLRISNFLLWQIAYSELYFTDTLWPDFNKLEMEKALEEYQRRERRFGGIK